MSNGGHDVSALRSPDWVAFGAASRETVVSATQARPT
jgi:hypothetical protein